MHTNRHVLLGIFFVSIIALLAWYTLFKTDFSLLTERQQWSVRFAEAGGLRQGDSVLVAGMRWGRVESLTFDSSAEAHERVGVRGHGRPRVQLERRQRAGHLPYMEGAPTHGRRCHMRRVAPRRPPRAAAAPRGAPRARGRPAAPPAPRA